MLSVLVAVMAGGAIRVVCKRLRRPVLGENLSIVCGIIIGGLLFIPMFRWVDAKATVTKLGVDPASLSGHWCDIDLPTHAVDDFCFQISGRDSSPRADFQMPKEAFVQWMTSQGWPPQEFRTDAEGMIESVGTKHHDDYLDPMDVTVYPLRSGRGFGGLIVEKGYYVGRDCHAAGAS